MLYNTSHLNTAPCLPQVLPPLVGVCPEARLNMAIYHLRRGEAEQAFKVVKDLDPVAPPEYILKGVSGHLEGAFRRGPLKQEAPPLVVWGMQLSGMEWAEHLSDQLVKQNASSRWEGHASAGGDGCSFRGLSGAAVNG